MKGKKTGGRKKGVANKATAITKEIFADLLSEYQQTGALADDFNKLSPRDRIYIAEKLAQYCIPKIQSVAVDLNDSDSTLSIEEKLITLANI